MAERVNKETDSRGESPDYISEAMIRSVRRAIDVLPNGRLVSITDLLKSTVFNTLVEYSLYRESPGYNKPLPPLHG